MTTTEKPVRTGNSYTYRGYTILKSRPGYWGRYRNGRYHMCYEDRWSVVNGPQGLRRLKNAVAWIDAQEDSP